MANLHVWQVRSMSTHTSTLGVHDMSRLLHVDGDKCHIHCVVSTLTKCHCNHNAIRPTILTREFYVSYNAKPYCMASEKHAQAYFNIRCSWGVTTIAGGWRQMPYKLPCLNTPNCHCNHTATRASIVTRGFYVAYHAKPSSSQHSQSATATITPHGPPL
jgi:hypothetical protein